MRKRQTWLGLPVLAALAIGSLFLAEPARANDYSGNCANYPGTYDGTGNVTINDSNCTLSQDISAGGSVTITATGGIDTAGFSITSGSATDLILSAGGNITANNLTAGGNLRAVTSSGTINVTGNILSNAYGLNGNIWLTATGNIFANSISTNGGSGTGGVQIDANTSGTNTPFTIGSSTANGIGTSVNTSNTTGGGTAPGFIHGGVFITNGNASSTGGITVSSMAAIQVNASASRSGLIILNAQNGTLSFPAGTLNSNGAAGQGAGYILLMAKKIATVDGTILSASQDYTASGTSHGVTLAAATVTVAGANGLVISADGNGITGSTATAYATLAPVGSFSVTSNNDLATLTWTTNSSNFYNVNAGVTVSGAAPLKMTADGNYGRVSITGHPVNFTNKSVILQSQAATDHAVYLAYYGAVTNSLGFGFNTTSTVTVDVSAVKRAGDTTARGGDIVSTGDQLVFNATTTKFVANGPTAGDGDGGTIYVGGSSAAIKTTSKVTFTANAASAGTGNAQASAVGGTGPKAIQFFPGSVNLDIGSAAGQYLFSAKGGSTGGDGGTILIASYPVNIKTANAINASAIAGNGNGGEIYFYSYIQSFDAAATMTAIGKGTGKGGKFTAYYQAPVGGLNVNTILKVDGGNSLRTVAENDFGRITLNNTPCQQRTTGTTSWPITYWNCVSPDGSTTNEQSAYQAAQKLHVNMKTGLNTQKVQMYLFNDVTKFTAFHGVGPQDTTGVSGYSDLNLKVSGAFKFELYSNGNTNISPYYSGTMIHELGHQLDENVWGIASQNNATWLAANADATTAFDDPALPPPAVNNCPTVVDADRVDPSVGLPAICSLFDGLPAGEQFLTNTVGLSTYGGVPATDKSERFVRAFAMAYNRKYPTFVKMQTYNKKFDARVPKEQQYMDQMIVNGQP